MNRIDSLKQRLIQYNESGFANPSQWIDRSAIEWQRLLLPALPEFNQWGNQNPCEICGNYGYGIRGDKALCIEHWLDTAEKEVEDARN